MNRGCLGCGGLGALLLVIALAWQMLTWPDVGKLVSENPTTTSFIERYQKREKAAGRGGAVEWKWVPAAGISANLRRAVIVAEDGNFYRHHGFDMDEIRKSIAEAKEEREFPRGASTITQQLAKNLWLSPSRNPLRKVKEVLLTRALERRLAKARILELYLNVVEFGPGVYGAEAAARHYFGHSAAVLTPREAMQLAASLPKPSLWHPGSGSRTYQRRVERLLKRMERSG